MGGEVRLTGAQRELARHALGLPNSRRRSYRNRFVTDGGADHAAWTTMVSDGFARVRKGVSWMGGMDAFWLTEAGARLALNDGESLCPEDFPTGRAVLEEAGRGE